jgi:hypothetical protein
MKQWLSVKLILAKADSPCIPQPLASVGGWKMYCEWL